MHKIQGKSTPSIFLPKFRKPHSYPTRFSYLNYVKPIPKLNKYGISCSRPFIWNNFL